MQALQTRTALRRAPCQHRKRTSTAVRASSGPTPLEKVINTVTVAMKNSPINQGKKMVAKLQAGDYDVVATAEKIRQLIDQEPVVVFSWSGCPFCKRAKSLLTDIGAAYKAVELDTMDDGKAIRAELANLTDRTSVPQIWINGEFVGGCNDGPGVATLHNEGKLVPLLQKAGAMRGLGSA